MIKGIIKRFLASQGYSLNRVSDKQSGPGDDTMIAGLRRIKKLGINPSTIVDIGAAQGTWTVKALSVWPSSKYELVEPLTEQVKWLEGLKNSQSHARIDYHLAVAGEQVGEIWMNVSDDLDGSGIYGDQCSNGRKVPVLKIDDITINRSGDFFLKLDTHGFEIPILKGSANTLKNTAVLVIEAYGFHVSPTAILLDQLIAYLDELGFRLFDIVDIMRRPGDHAFWQCDAFFIRKDHPVFEKSTYA